MGGRGGELNKKQAQFVREYLIDLNATQAAIRAGYSSKTAEWIGPQLLGKTHVAEAVQKAMADRSQRTEVTADRVLQEIARIAFADVRNVVTFGPSGVVIKSSVELDDATAAAISEVSETTTKDGGSKRVKLCSKEKALELAARHLGMLNDKMELSGSLEKRVREMTPGEIQAELDKLEKGR